MNKYVRLDEVRRAVLHNEGQAVIAAIDELKTFEIAPLAEWKHTDAFPHRVYCSHCYKTYVPNDKWQIWVDGDLPRNYCPNCGAKMEAEK